MINKSRNAPRISIICPYFNTGEYIRESIESILSQSYTDFEYFLINDGSEDNSEQIVQEYSKLDSRIRNLINTHKKGIAGASNTALNLARGEFIALMDSDDISLPNRLEKQVAFLDNKIDINVVGSAMLEFGRKNNDSVWEFASDPDILKITCLIHTPVPNPTALVRRKALQDYSIIYNEEFPMNQDYDFFLKLIKHVKFSNIPEVLHKYRIHENNTSNSNNQIDFEYWKLALSNFLEGSKIIISDRGYEILYQMKYPSFNQTYKKNEEEINSLIDSIIEVNEKTHFFNSLKLKAFFTKRSKAWRK